MPDALVGGQRGVEVGGGHPDDAKLGLDPLAAHRAGQVGAIGWSHRRCVCGSMIGVSSIIRSIRRARPGTWVDVVGASRWGRAGSGVRRAIAEPTYATVEVLMNRPRRDGNAARAGVR